MAWDHCKDFLADYKGNDGTVPPGSRGYDPAPFGQGAARHGELYVGPLEMFSGKPAYALARFVSHLCAPGFSALMGAGMVLLRESRVDKGWSEARVLRFFVIRGLLLIALGFVVRASFLVLLIDPPPEFKERAERRWPTPVLADLLGFFQVLTSLGLQMISTGLVLFAFIPVLRPSNVAAQTTQWEDELHDGRGASLENSPSFVEAGSVSLLRGGGAGGERGEPRDAWPSSSRRSNLALTVYACCVASLALLALEQVVIVRLQGPDPALARTTDALTAPEIFLRFTLVPGEFDTLPSQNYFPFVPWMSCCLLGVAYGAGLTVAPQKTLRGAAPLGFALVALFVVGRLLGGRAFSFRGWPLGEGRDLSPLISFLNVCKYPPGFAYVSLTLGLNLLLMAALGRVQRPERHTVTRALLAYGRAPLAFYIVHFWIITTGLALVYALTGIHAFPLFTGVVAIWLGLLAVMKVFCERYATWKQSKPPGSLWAFL